MMTEDLKAKVDAYVDEVWEDVVSAIGELVQIPSVEDKSKAEPGKPWGPASYNALMKGLQIAERLGLDAHNMEGYIGYADLPGASERQIATIAHTDVVPEGLGWTVDPFALTRREGYLMGRGVLDDKGPFVLSLYAAHFFKRQVERTGQQLPYTLRCIVGNEEETNMGDVDYYLAHQPQPAFCFSPDADFPLICGEKGIYHGSFTAPVDVQGRIVELDGGTVANAICGRATAVVRAEGLPAREHIELDPAGEGLTRVVAHGKGGHASLPEGTVNAIGLLADYLLDFDVCSDGERPFLVLLHALCASGHDGAALGIKSADEKFGPLTAIGGTIRTQDGTFVQTCDVRYPTSITDEEITDALTGLAAAHGARFAVDAFKVPFYIDPGSQEIQTLLATYGEYTGTTPEAFVIGGGTYARKFERACAFGPHDPSEDVPAWVGPEHGADEAVSEKSLKTALKVYIVSIARLMELDL